MLSGHAGLPRPAGVPQTPVLQDRAQPEEARTARRRRWLVAAQVRRARGPSIRGMGGHGCGVRADAARPNGLIRSCRSATGRLTPMPRRSVTELIVLHALGLKGFGDATAVVLIT